MEKLTEQDFWRNYWLRHPVLYQPVKQNYIFGDVFQKIYHMSPFQSALEVGGFPGFYALYLKKHLRIEHVALLDYFIDYPLMQDLWQRNGLSPAEVEVIHTDLFEYNPPKKYDMVFSVGLIEHFSDTESILKEHVKFLADDGYLMVAIPNFRGLNGWIQKVFDRGNYDKHYIPCMSKTHLRTAAEALGLKVVHCDYYKVFSVWLEKHPPKPWYARILVKTIWLTGKVLSKLIPVKTRWFSPYIVLIARK